jgi:plasmid stabilization system protein ParE
MNITFLSSAEDEFLEAIAYYNQQSEGLGFEFALEIERTLERILQYPEAWTPLSKRTRRCRTNRFPYGVIYQIRGESILIIAIMHLNKHPDSWKSRLKKTER